VKENYLIFGQDEPYAAVQAGDFRRHHLDKNGTNDRFISFLTGKEKAK
jgi:hypothetical protein